MRDDEIRVSYRLTETIPADELHALESMLSADERERCARFVFAHDRRDFTVAHALLRGMLSECGDRLPLEWRFEAAEHGKPRLVEAQSNALTFNLSHTRGLVACAVARDTDIGVDVESLSGSTARREVVERYFSAAENRCLGACPPHHYARRFAEVWTLKEAYIKALGTGLNHPLDSFSFEVDGERVRFERRHDDVPCRWQFAVASPARGFCLAVAVRCAPTIDRYGITVRDANATNVITPLSASSA